MTHTTFVYLFDMNCAGVREEKRDEMNRAEKHTVFL